MTATLPTAITAFTQGHVVTPTEWAQILAALSVTNLSFVIKFNAGVTTASATFVNLDALNIPITKIGGATTSDFAALLVTSQSNSVASASTSYAVNDGTTDWATHQSIGLTAGLPYFAMGGVLMTGLAAGSYTFQARWKVSAGTATAGGSGSFVLFVIEVPK